MEPYAKWFNKNQALYIPQFDTIDTQELLKPVTGDDVILSTSLYTPNNVYQWQKLNPTTNSFENISGNAAQKVDYVFVFNGSASEGNYTTVVTNTLLPGLSYTRRPIVLETCGSVFDASYKIFNDLAACYGKDTLVVDVTDKSTNTNVSVNVKHWYFDNHLLNNIYDLKLPIEISGTYKYAVLDNLTKCLIQSKNIAAVTNYNYKPTISFDAQNDSSLVVNNVDTSTLAYQWYINELPIASATGNSLRIYFNGNYHVDAISKRNCVSSSSKEKVIAFTRDFIRAEHQTNANGQILLNTSQSVDIYPNPASDVFKFVNINAGSTVTIADMNGQELLSMVVTDVNSGIETNNLPAGMYQVKISFGESITYRKLVIKK